MKVLIALPSQGVYGGMELFALTLADALQRGGRHEVRLCFKLVAGHAAQPALTARCAELGLDAVFCARASRTLWDALRWAELVHAQNCSPDIGLLARVLRKPLVVTVHNWRRGGRSLLHASWRVVHDGADYRTYNSAFVMKTWQRAGAAARSSTIPTVAPFGGAPRPPAQRRGFFFIGRWIEGKGLQILVQAYQQAALDKAAWPLCLAGDGPLRDEVRERVRRGGAEGITLPGFLSEADKHERLASARWLVCPPHTHEDMGLTPIEARAVGVPAIVSVDGGLPEAAGPHAVFVPPGDVQALARALELVSRMPEQVYAERARGAQDSLAGYLKPLSVYEDIYREVMSLRT